MSLVDENEGVNELLPVEERGSHPKVAFLVAAYNAEKSIASCLEAILKQSPGTVLVVDDGSTDRTREIVEQYPTVTLISLASNQGVAAARNHGLSRLTDEDYVAIIDSDIILADDWLAKVIQGCDWDQFDACCGLVLPIDAGLHWCASLDLAVTRKHFTVTPGELSPPWQRVMYFNYLIKRKVFDTVGLFDPFFRTNAEDSDFFYRAEQAGFRFLYQPQATGTHHYPRPKFLPWLKKNMRNGYYTMFFHLKHHTALVRMKIIKWIGLFLIAPFILYHTFHFHTINELLKWLVILLLLWLWEELVVMIKPRFFGPIRGAGLVARSLGEVVAFLSHQIK